MQAQSWRYVQCVASTSSKVLYESGRITLASKVVIGRGNTISLTLQRRRFATVSNDVDVQNRTRFNKDEISSRVNQVTIGEPTKEPSLCLEILNRIDSGNKGKEKDLERIIAYIQLRTQSPDLISSISHQGIEIVAKQAIDQGFTQILTDLLWDIENRIYQSPQGSSDRTRTICSILNSLIASESGNERNTGSRPFKNFGSEKIVIKQNWTNIKEALCRLLMREIEALEHQKAENVGHLNLLENLNDETVKQLLSTIALIDEEQEMLSFVFVLLDHVRNQSDSSLYLEDIPSTDLLIHYLLKSSSNSDAVMANYAIHHLSSILADLELKLSSLHLDGFRLYSSANLTRLMDRCTNSSSESENSKLEQRLQIHSSIALLALQEGFHSIALRNLSEMMTELDITFSTKGISSFEIELVVLQGLRFVLRSSTCQSGISQEDHQLIPKLFSILIRHSLLNPQSDDLLWLRDYGYSIVGAKSCLQFVEILVITIKEVESVTKKEKDAFDVMSLISGELIVSLIERICESGDKIRLKDFLCETGLMTKDGRVGVDNRIDNLFDDILRVRLILACSSIQLNGYTIALYKKWMDDDKGEINFDTIKEQLTKIEKHTGTEESEKIHSAVSLSSQCIAAVIHTLTTAIRYDWHKKVVKWESYEKGNNIIVNVEEEEEIPIAIQYAYKALFSFINAKDVRVWSEKDMVNVAYSLFRLGHPRMAYHCISMIPTRNYKYSANAISVFIQGMSEIELEKSVDNLETFSKTKGISDLIDAKMIIPVIMHALAKRDLELVNRLNELSDSLDLSKDSTIQIIRLLSLSDVNNQIDGPGKDDKTFKRLFAIVEGRLLNESAIWDIQPSLLRKLIGQFVQESERMLQKGDSEESSNKMLQMAINLLRFGSYKLKRVDHIAVIKILSSIHSESENKPSYEQKERYRRQKISQLDSIVSEMRWVPEYCLDMNEGNFINVILEKDDNTSGKKKSGFPKDQVNALKTQSKFGSPNLPINILPTQAFRSLILAYFRVGDMLGAASVIQWLRDECEITLEDLSQGWTGRGWRKTIKHSIFTSQKRGSTVSPARAFRWITETEDLPMTKRWWYDRTRDKSG